MVSIGVHARIRGHSLRARRAPPFSGYSVDQADLSPRIRAIDARRRRHGRLLMGGALIARSFFFRRRSFRWNRGPGGFVKPITSFAPVIAPVGLRLRFFAFAISHLATDPAVSPFWTFGGYVAFSRL